MNPLYVALWNNMTLVTVQLFKPANVKSSKAMLFVSLPVNCCSLIRKRGVCHISLLLICGSVDVLSLELNRKPPRHSRTYSYYLDFHNSRGPVNVSQTNFHPETYITGTNLLTFMKLHTNMMLWVLLISGIL